MCFYDVGNHGGGPKRKIVKLILEHQDYAPGVRVEFSTPVRYFAAVEASAAACPVVEGELLHHAIGCCSVCGRLKREIRNAELAAVDAERLAARHQVDLAKELEPAWRTIRFNQFHDIIAGSSTLHATEEAQRHIGGARDQIEQATYRMRRRDSGIRDRELKGHRIHVVNRTDLPWQGMAEVGVQVFE
jgi:alpha-mannosidase